MDANNDFTASAKKFDSQLEASVTKMMSRRGEEENGAAGGGVKMSLPPAPVHVTAHLDPGTYLPKKLKWII